MTRHQRTPLTRDRVIAAALALVDDRGAAALTMRNLAAALNVEAMSLYHHVTNREDLLDGIADRLVANGLPTPPPNCPWPDAVRSFCNGIRATAQQHPAAFQLVGLRPLRSEQALRPVLGLLDCLLNGGVPPATAVAGYRHAAAYARGFSLAEIAGLTLAGATPPATSTDVTEALRRSNDDVFRDGTEILITGLSHTARLADPRDLPTPAPEA